MSFTDKETRPELTRDARANERGYTLVALLAVLSLMALFALAAAPRVTQQAQREREKEAIFRGEEISDAIKAYYVAHGAQGTNSLPTSMDQLLEGIPRGSKKIQILRVEAIHDPLTTSGEWRQIGPTSQEMAQFVQALTIYSSGSIPPPKSPFQGLARLIPQVTNILNTESTDTAPGGEDSSANAEGPFIGVASRSQRNSVITYYGIDRHDQWIFTPLFK